MRYVWVGGEENTHDDEELIDTSQTTSNGSRCVFGDVEGVDHGCETSTETTDESKSCLSVITPSTTLRCDE